MRITKLQNTIYKMMTENTGSHLLDSGSAYGRNHELNAKKTIQDFLKQPECTLDLYRYVDKEKNETIEKSVTINIFHYLDKNLELDSICNKFNSRKVSDWDSEEFYGVSKEGEDFILKTFDTDGDSFNTYNWDSSFSQVMQGRRLEHKETGEKYVLLQIHGGCDVRGGYTNAKLFKICCDHFLYENCYFKNVDWLNSEFITFSGRYAEDRDFAPLIKKYLKNKNEYQLAGTLGEV